MSSRRRPISLTTICLLMLGVMLAPAQAQEAVPDSPAELRNFELKPSADLKATIEREPRSGPPADFPVPAPTERSTAPSATPKIDPGPPPVTTPSFDAPAAAERSTIPARRRTVAAPPPGATNNGPAQFIANPGLSGGEVAAAPLPPSDAPSEDDIAAAAPTETPITEAAAPAGKESELPWLNILLGTLAAIALAFGISQRRRALRAQAEVEEAGQAALEADERLRLARASEEAQPQPAANAVPAPKPAPAAATPPPSPPAPKRPWIELEFKPETAAANDVQAQVLYSLIVRNTGSLPAENVRIAARMFNIEAERSAELPQFFAAPIGQPSFPPRVIAPGEEVTLRSNLVMPRSEMRAIIVQERKLFIPLAAFNILYEWERGEKGQTAMSYVVGREAETPTQKMGPFRLDLGPRIYRSVGQRPSDLARVA